MTSAPMLHVHVRAPGIDERLAVLLEHTLAIGRDAECDVELPSATVSRRHVSLFLRDGGLVVRDHSSNGTRVNGERLHLAVRELGEQAQLEVGPYALALRLGALPCASGRATEQGAAQPPPLPAASAAPPTSDQLALEVFEPLLRDPTVSAIMVVDAATVFVERAGCIERTSGRFCDDDAVHAELGRLLGPLGLQLDAAHPIVDARLPDGSLLHAIFPPLALRGPCITIRKRDSFRPTLMQLVERGALSPAMASFLASAVQARTNIVICGAAGAGKTTLLNALGALISERERVVTIEDVPELALAHPHLVSLAAQPSEPLRKGRVGLDDLIETAHRMRPDRILVGECRAGEALAVLQALCAGHDGSMTTLHAHSPRDALARLESWCSLDRAGLTPTAIRQQVAASVELLVHQGRAADGGRQTVHIAQLIGVDARGELELRQLFPFERGPGDAERTDGDRITLASRGRCPVRCASDGLEGDDT